MGYSKNVMSPNIGGDDVTNAVCEFDKGILGTIESSYCARGKLISIWGTKGFITVHIKGERIEMRLQEKFTGEIIDYKQPGKHVYKNINTKDILFTKDNPYDQHINFIESVKENKEPPVKVEDGLYDLKIVKRIYQSAKKKKMILV